MPGLIRGVARTAVVAGTATAVSNRVSRRQANRWADQSQQAAPPPEQYEEPQQYAAPPPQTVYVAAPPAAPEAPAGAGAGAGGGGSDLVAELTRLAELKSSGILSEEEFAAAKAKLLS